MKRISFFSWSLMLVVLVSGLVFTGCSEDEEETPMDKVLTNVEGSKWSAVHNGGYFNLSFKNGHYTLTYDYGGTSSSVIGTYNQNGRSLKFEENNFITYTIQKIKTGEISEYGSSMTVPVYDDNYISKEIDYTLKFTLNIAK